MISQSPSYCTWPVRNWFRLAVSAGLLALIGACATPPQKPPVPTVEEIARQQRLERAQANLSEGLKKYDIGIYDEAIRNFLLALDSGQLTVPEQLTARKHMAFIHCLSSREANCKEEFDKMLTLDPKFDLSAAEAGHPTWGPVFRLVRTEIELRKSGRTFPVAKSKVLTSGEKSMLDAMKAYDDADYPKAIKSFQDALKETLTNADRVAAHKFIAFSYCLTNRMSLCRAEFEPIFKLDANFDLEPAEAGHPSWGPSFRTVKAKQKPGTPSK